MNDNDRKGPGDADREERAQHGYRNEVSWDGGKGAQPYTNQEEEKGPATARETEAGNRGEASGRNLEQLEQLRRKPEPPETEAPRESATGDSDGVS
jgi:hypothetical protein